MFLPLLHFATHNLFFVSFGINQTNKIFFVNQIQALRKATKVRVTNNKNDTKNFSVCYRLFLYYGGDLISSNYNDDKLIEFFFSQPLTFFFCNLR